MSNSNNVGVTQTTNILPVQALYDPLTLAFITFIGPAGIPFTSAAGGVSSVNVSGGTTGLTTSGGPIVSSGTITLGGTLSVSNGGTGATTSNGALTNLLPSQTGNAGAFLTTNGTTTSWSASASGITITNDTTTNASRYLTFTSATSGVITAENVSTSLIFNPSSNSLTATTFIGALTGNASTATSATTATNIAGGTSGALVYQSSSGSTTFLTAGSNGQYLTLASGVPSWTNLSTVSSFSAGTTGLTPNTATTGAVTLAGTLAVANGGTGVTSSSGASSVVLRDANTNTSANVFFNAFTNVGASGTTTSLSVSSTYNWVITGSGGQTFTMPDATTLPVGATYTFNNNQTSGAIVVNNRSSTLIVSIPSGGYVTVILLTNGNSAGTWDYHFDAPSNVSWSTNTFSYSGSITNATWNGVAIGATYGGTGQTTYATGDILYASATNTLSKLSAGTNGYVLTLAGGVPTWATTASGTTITDDTSTNSTRYINFTSATSGALSTIYTSSTKLQYNPSTGVLTSTGFSGSGSNLTFGTGTLSLAGNVTHSGAYTQTFIATGNTSVTLPTSGTLVNTAVTTLSSLASIGTITTGTWNGSVIGATYGGTGVNNGSNTITLSGSFTTSGAFTTTLTVTANTNVTLPTIGTLATLAGTETFTNKTLTNPTVTNYVETLYAPSAGSAFTISLANGTVQEITLNANGTITLPSSVAGKSFTIIVTYSGSYSLTWAGGGTLKWAGGTTPTATSTSGKYDIFNFYCDGTNTYGAVYGLNF